MPRFEISELARKHAPWSYSKAETAQTCPAQFRHKYLIKSKGAAAASDNRVGIVAHKILERTVSGEAYGDARRAAIEQNPLTSDELDILRTFHDNIDSFLLRFDRFCKAERVTRILTETSWGFTEDYRATEFFAKDVYFRGSIDLGAVTGDATLFMIDHKSGEAKDLARDQNKRMQLNAYAVLAVPNMPEIAGVRGGIHFLQGGDPTLRLQWTDFIPSDRIEKVYASWLFGRINECASNLAHDRYEARPAKKMPRGWPCAWCSYSGLCPAFQEKFNG